MVIVATADDLEVALDMLVNHGVPIQYQARCVRGISGQMVSEDLLFKSSWPVIESSLCRNCVIIYDVNFD